MYSIASVFFAFTISLCNKQWECRCNAETHCKGWLLKSSLPFFPAFKKEKKKKKTHHLASFFFLSILSFTGQIPFTSFPSLVSYSRFLLYQPDPYLHPNSGSHKFHLENSGQLDSLSRLEMQTLFRIFFFFFPIPFFILPSSLEMRELK